MESSFENLEVMHSRSGALEREKKGYRFLCDLCELSGKNGLVNR